MQFLGRPCATSRSLSILGDFPSDPQYPAPYDMDSVVETPAKRRRIDDGYNTGNKGYNSADDSGDDLFNNYETVATLPLPNNPDNRDHLFPGGPTPIPQFEYVTQPTQIINGTTPNSDGGRKPSVIQVAASSPLAKSAAQSPSPAIRIPSVSLASSMAPPGTAYRSPAGVRKPDPVVELSSDEDDTPIHLRNSSDEESQLNRKADIKPSNFIQSARNDSRSANTDRFKEITSQSFYKPMESIKPGQTSSSSRSEFSADPSGYRARLGSASATKRSADVMADAYGNASRRNNVRQVAPAKAQPIPDITLDEIEDYQIRTKVERMRNIFPAQTIAACKAALIRKKGNYDDALDYLAVLEEKGAMIDLTSSDHEHLPPKPTIPAKPAAKQQLKAPAKSIQSKWASTQAFSQQAQASSPTSPKVSAPKPRKRLVQGRKNLPTPATSGRSSPAAREESILVDVDTGSDSAIGTESEEQDLERKVLGFLNTCTNEQLADIAAVTETVASTILSKRPFKNLDAVRQVSGDTKTNAKRKATRPIGDKIVDSCLDMWRGYDAIDGLVRHCESVGRPIAEAIKQWGVDVYGATNEGELDLTNFDQKSNASLRDSGIGTPTSAPASPDADGEVKVAPAKDKNGVLGQPRLMHEDVVLKDYQIVGVNWLALLYERRLSCILADDMGLGKTCQVIAFLAHLFEKGNKGPHLVIVPGSTIENWLREFSVFCPKLTVMPYYGKLLPQLIRRVFIY